MPSSGHTSASCMWPSTSQWPVRRSAASPAMWPAKLSTHWPSTRLGRGEKFPLRCSQRHSSIKYIYTDCGQKNSCGNISLSSNYLNIKALMSYIANVVHYLLYTYLEGQDSSAVDGKLCFSVQLLQL